VEPGPPEIDARRGRRAAAYFRVEYNLFVIYL
jgi:hypothetical protein